MNFLFCTVKMKSESKPLSTPTFSFFNKVIGEAQTVSLWTELSLRFHWNKATAAFSPLSSAV